VVRLGLFNKCARLISASNTIIDHGFVSKQHFRIYAIIYDLEKKHEFQPLIYCEDLQTTNGTFVNGRCIGAVGQEKVGNLLTHGDVVEIRPYWRFRFHQPGILTASRSQTQLDDLEVCFTSSTRYVSNLYAAV
jgi:pSer/pThr/pTyr-binding forkhead associated (FHA) protein